MEKKANSLVSLAALALLAACECGDSARDAAGTDVAVLEDEALAGSAADFIAKAGDRVFYEYDKSNISPEAEATLSRQADWLKQHSERKILVEGHCDERGTREYNLGLGERRADAAARYLVDHGVPGDRVRTISYGKDRPIAAQGTQEEVYRMNRVAISVVE
ncbi:MAG: OmpA family protein [Holosporaceae bacterium]|jgi:peptidoglycan-associated lipoprotein|nr:OmpA family protein [Holosporaceae bacterium]